MKKKSYLTRAVLAMVASGMLYANVGFAAKTVTTDTTLTPTGASSFLDADKLINVKDATLTLNNDTSNKWVVDFKISQATNTDDSTLKLSTSDRNITLGSPDIWSAGAGIYTGYGVVNVKNIIVDGAAIIVPDCLGSNVNLITINEGKTLEFKRDEGFPSENVTIKNSFNGTGYLALENKDATGAHGFVLAEGETIGVKMNIKRSVRESGELIHITNLTANANQLIGTEDIENAGILTLTGGTLKRNVVEGTYSVKANDSDKSLGNQTGKGYVIMTAPLTIADGVSVTADIYGAKGSGSTAITGKNVNITGGTLFGTIYGAYSDSGNVSSNTVKLTNVTMDLDSESHTQTFAGWAKNGTAEGNTFELNNSVIDNYDVSGGYGVLAKNNEVKLQGGKITNGHLTGGYSDGDAGSVENNKVTVNGGTVYTLEGGRGRGAGTVVKSNKVSVDDSAIVTGDIYGGMSESNSVSDNVVDFKSGTILAPQNADTHVENKVYGGLAEGKGNVTGNSVTVSGGSFTRTSVIGGKSLGTGDVTGNSVVITGGTFTGGEHNGIAGATFLYDFDASVISAVELGSANNNSVKITDGTFNGMTNGNYIEYINVCGGLIEVENFDDDDESHKTALKTYYTTGGASNNTVEIVTTKAVTFGDVAGGGTFQGDANGNKVIMSGNSIVVENDITGGGADEDDVDIRVNANNNILTLTNITVNDSVGGGEGSGTGSTALNNEVHIFGGNYTNTHKVHSGKSNCDADIVGGEAWTNASENIVEIQNATVSSCAVIGGIIKDLDGTVKDNKVVLDGVTFNFGGDSGQGYIGTLVAGGCVDNTTGTFTGIRSGNSLEVGSKGFTVNTGKAVIIKNFDSMTFADGATVTNNGTLTFGDNGSDKQMYDAVWNAPIKGTGKVVVVGDSKVDNTISNSGGIDIQSGKLRVFDAGDIATSVVNKGGLILYSGTLAQTVDNTNGTIKLHGVVGLTQKVSGGLIEIKDNGSTLRLDNGVADKLVINELVAYNYYGDEKPSYKDTVNKISFDAGFTSVVDQVSATTYKGTITLDSVALKEGFDGAVGSYKYYQLFTGTTDFSDLTINGSAEAAYGEFKYVFVDSGNNDGTLKVTKDYGYTLPEFIQNSDAKHVAGKISVYTLYGDKKVEGDLGTLTRVDSAVARTFTIDGNEEKYKLLGEGYQGITVNSGDTLVLKNISEISGFSGAAVNNSGTLNLSNVTLKNDITGTGTTNVDGNVSTNSLIGNNIKILATGSLDIVAEKIGSAINNLGTLKLRGAVLSQEVTGNGTLDVNDDITSTVDLVAGTINLDDTSLIMSEGTLLNIGTVLNMEGSKAKVTLDRGNVLDANLAVLSGMGTKINGVNGELVLRMSGVNYTATQHKTAKEALFTSGEAALLTFKDANLVIGENEVLSVGGTTTVTDNNMVISGAEPTVVNKQTGEVVENVGSQADKTVTVAENGKSTAAKVDTITLDANSNLTAKDLLVGGVVTAGKVLKITVDGESKLSLVGGDKGLVKTEQTVVVPDLDVKEGSVLNLGDSEGKAANVVAAIKELTVGGSVNAKNIGLNIASLVMNGGHIVFDPNYYQVNKLNFTSGGDLAVVTDGTVLAVGQVMDEGGTTDITAQEVKKALDSAGIATTATANGGYTVNNGKAVLAVMDDPIDLTATDSYLAVDVGNAEMTKALQLGDGAILVARKAFAEKDIPTVKVNSASDVTISDKAELVIEAEKYMDADGKFISYTILGNGTDVYDTLWTVDENIYAADPTYTFHLVDGKLTADWNKVEGIFGENAIAAPDMYNRILQKAQGTEANAFLKKVITETAGAGSTAATKAVGANALNAATSMGELAAVQHGAVSMANQMGDTLSENLGLAARPITDGKYDKKIWASYVNNKETVEDLALAKVNADYTAKYRGASVGADLWSSEKAVGGLAITYSKGDVNGHNGGVTTNNDAKYYGVSVYNRINVGNDGALLYDFDYLNTKNEISQHNFGINITADAKVDVLSAGVRYEKGITTGKSVLAPFVGLRYLHLNNKEYTNSLNMHFSADKQNVFQPSVGLNWHGEFQAPNSVWTYRPYIETGYVWNMGNRDCNQVVSFDGAPNTLAYDVVDSGSYFAKLGLNFERKHFGFGFGYKYQKGSTAKISRWNVDMNWKF